MTESIFNYTLVISTSTCVNIVDQQGAARTYQFLPSSPGYTLKKSTTPTFLLELPLAVALGQAKRLRADFEAARCLYHALLGEALHRLKRWQPVPTMRSAGSAFRPAISEEGNQGWLVWGKLRIPAIINWDDPVVKNGLEHRIKYARLVRRKVSSPRAKGTDAQGYRYSVQLALEGISFQRPKNKPGRDVIGLDLEPSTLAIVPREGEVRLVPLCEEMSPDVRMKRRLARKLDRQRRANNPQKYDEKGRVKKRGKGRITWENSKGYLVTRRRLAHQERKLAAHRSAGTIAPAGLAPSSVTCTRHFSPPTLTYQTSLPLVPNTICIGRVRNCACGQHQSDYTNVRKRGKSCLEAWAFPAQERVCLKVLYQANKGWSIDEVG